MKSEWIATYDNTEIKITNSWFSGEKLYVNKQLQDEQLNFFSSNLTGAFVDAKGEKRQIKANLSGFFSISCRLFIDHEKIEVVQVR